MGKHGGQRGWRERDDAVGSQLSPVEWGAEVEGRCLGGSDDIQ